MLNLNDIKMLALTGMTVALTADANGLAENTACETTLVRDVTVERRAGCEWSTCNSGRQQTIKI